MKLLSSENIKKADKLIMEEQGISSVQLMEKAAHLMLDEIKKLNASEFYIFCGPGNNGGDGLVIAYELYKSGNKVDVFYIPGNLSEENSFYRKILKDIGLHANEIQNNNGIELLSFKDDGILIDALFGIGLNKPVTGIASFLIKKINAFKGIKIAIDIPSGLSADLKFLPNNENTILANQTLSVHGIKKAFLFKEFARYAGKIIPIEIGLSDEIENKLECHEISVDRKICKKLLKKRNRFSYKKTFGHVLNISGSEGKYGAKLLSCKAALRSGCGLVTTIFHREANNALLAFCPEVMTIEKQQLGLESISKYNAIAFGPGLEPNLENKILLEEILNSQKPTVLDAGAIDLLANYPELKNKIKNCILTPHPGEFDRLTILHQNSIERLESARKFSCEYQCIVVLKGTFTATCLPNNTVFFNTTGNSGMATAGSGDVLTGILSSLLAQQYELKNAAILGVYLHGLAGDIALKTQSEESLVASDMIENIGKAFQTFK